jgi:uroporphyrinogen-III decarboxylase
MPGRALFPNTTTRRRRAGAFFHAGTPSLAAEDAAPLERFPLDAAICSRDILTIPDAMGPNFSRKAGTALRAAATQAAISG